MKRATLFQIARDGWLVLIPVIVLLFVVHALVDWWAALPVAGLLVLAIMFFRDRPRQVSAGPLDIVAPVDGIVAHANRGHDPFLDREAIKISIRVDMLGAYYLRSPVEGTLLAFGDDAPGAPSARASWLRTDEGDDIVFAISRGRMLVARPCLVNIGARVGQGRCCGLRRMARSIDVYLPLNARVMVEPGERVDAGATELATLVPKRQPSSRPAER